MKKISILYTKYIIKSSLLYYTFLLSGIILFLTLTLNLKVEVVESYTGYYENNRIVINESLDYTVDTIYVYKTRGENVYRFSRLEKRFVEQYTILEIYDDNVLNNTLDGNITIEIVRGKTPLFNIIIGKDKKSLNETRSRL